MFSRVFCRLLLFLTVSCGEGIFAAPSLSPAKVQGQVQGMNNLLMEVLHRVENLESEFKSLQEQLNHQEESLQLFHKMQSKANQQIADSALSKIESLERTSLAMEKAFHLIETQMESLRKGVETQGRALVKLHDEQVARGSENQKQIDEMADHLKKLRGALQTLMEAMKEPQAADSVASIPSGGIFSAHKVQVGDSLGKIALQYGVTVRALRKVNKLSTDKIFVGQSLRIPKAAGS